MRLCRIGPLKAWGPPFSSAEIAPGTFRIGLRHQDAATETAPLSIARRKPPIREGYDSSSTRPRESSKTQAGADNRICGLVTPHDLLRGETAFDTAE